MLITNINLLIFLKDFILVFNCNIRKKKQVFNKEKQILIVINKKSIKKIREKNNANLRFVDQLILKKRIKNITN